MKSFFRLLINAFNYWREGSASARAAALAYYALASLAPLLIIIVAVAGALVNTDQIAETLVQPFQTAAGRENASFIFQVIENASESGSRRTATLVGIILLFFSASGLFRHLQATLNEFWHLKAPEPNEKDNKPNPPLAKRLLRAVLRELTARLKASAMIMVAGLLVMSTILMTSLLNFLNELIPNTIIGLNTLNQIASFIIITILFGSIYRYIPQTDIAWKEVLPGAAISAVIFGLLQVLLGLYFSRASVGSAYGTASSLLAFLFWAYYSIQAMFFGAAFTIVYTHQNGKPAPSPRSTI